jgi:hypothetical protein
VLTVVVILSLIIVGLFFLYAEYSRYANWSPEERKACDINPERDLLVVAGGFAAIGTALFAGVWGIVGVAWGVRQIALWALA